MKWLIVIIFAAVAAITWTFMYRYSTHTQRTPKLAQSEQGKISEITLDKFFALKNEGKVLIYDARSYAFFSLGHIPGAINLAMDKNSIPNIHNHGKEIKSALASNKVVVIYCASATCDASEKLAKVFSQFGYPVSVFKGGLEEWKEAGQSIGRRLEDF